MSELAPFSPPAWEKAVEHRTSRTSSGPYICIVYSKLVSNTYSQLRLAAFCFTNFMWPRCHYQVIIFINRQSTLNPNLIPFWLILNIWNINSRPGFSVFLNDEHLTETSKISNTFSICCHLSQITIPQNLISWYEMVALWLCSTKNDFNEYY